MWHPRDVPAHISEAFELFARGPVECYRALGVSGAHFAPVNDLQVEGRKIGGLGAATIGQAFVFVGSIISAFNARAAAGVLLIPDEKMRDKVVRTMEEYVSSLDRELGRRPAPGVIRAELVTAFERTLNARLVPGQLRSDEREMNTTWVHRMRSIAWLDEVRLPAAHARSLRITGNVRMGHAAHKAPGGLLRVTVIVTEDRITQALVSGDIYVVGNALQGLEKAIVGPADIGSVRQRLQKAWPPDALPGVSPDDLTEVVRLALNPEASRASSTSSMTSRTSSLPSFPVDFTASSKRDTS